MSRNARNGENGESGEKPPNAITRGAPCKEEKLTKMANLTKMLNLTKNRAKICHGVGKYSNWMPKVAPWTVAILTRKGEYGENLSKP